MFHLYKHNCLKSLLFSNVQAQHTDGTCSVMYQRYTPYTWPDQRETPENTTPFLSLLNTLLPITLRPLSHISTFCLTCLYTENKARRKASIETLLYLRLTESGVSPDFSGSNYPLLQTWPLTAQNIQQLCEALRLWGFCSSRKRVKQKQQSGQSSKTQKNGKEILVKAIVNLLLNYKNTNTGRAQHIFLL